MLRSGPVAGRRFKPSGPNIKQDQRNTVKLEIRCAPELAEQARAFVAARKERTLAQLIEAGLRALTSPGVDLAIPQGEQCSYCMGTGDRRGFEK